MESLITTEVENAILNLHYRATHDWAADHVQEQRDLNEQAAREVLNIFHDVSHEFIQIELGIERGDA